jgi:hypothetical protein
MQSGKSLSFWRNVRLLSRPSGTLVRPSSPYFRTIILNFLLSHYPEDGNRKLLRNVGNDIPDHMKFEPRKRHYSQSPP